MIGRTERLDRSRVQQNYSVSKKLSQNKKITPEFEIMLNCLTLEEVIALKLELAAKSIGGKFYGVPIWAATINIVKDAILKYALSTCKEKSEVCAYLGIGHKKLNQLIYKFDIEKYFNSSEDIY
jgi:hypothetical protein